jgi:hypothetical protein
VNNQLPRIQRKDLTDEALYRLNRNFEYLLELIGRGTTPAATVPTGGGGGGGGGGG